MSQASIKLSPECIKDIPLHTYSQDFTFVINGNEFQTSRLIAELLSPRIIQIHNSDPTIDKYYLNTTSKGDFSNVLNLVDFKDKAVPSDEIEFISEVLENFCNERITITEPIDDQELSEDNVFAKLRTHEKRKRFFRGRYEKEVEFVSMNFYKIYKDKKNELKSLDFNTLCDIVSNEKLQLEDEDQLLNFANEMYKEDNKYCILYESVLFERVSEKSICEFIDAFNIYDITSKTWLQLSTRLKTNVNVSIEKCNRYKKTMQKWSLPFTENNEFQGIINFLRSQSNDGIENILTITASSNNNPDSPAYKNVYNIVEYNDREKSFWTENIKDSWISIDFKNHKIIPSHYTIKSCNSSTFPKNFVIEVSNDNKKWEIIDTQNDCSSLRGGNYIHTFKINQQNYEPIRYIRIRQIEGWDNYYYLGIGLFEVYGTLI